MNEYVPVIDMHPCIDCFGYGGGVDASGCISPCRTCGGKKQLGVPKQSVEKVIDEFHGKLVAGLIKNQGRFLAQNAQILKRIEALEERLDKRPNR